MKTTMFVNGRKHEVMSTQDGWLLTDHSLPFAVRVDVKNNKLVPVIGSKS